MNKICLTDVISFANIKVVGKVSSEFHPLNPFKKNTLAIIKIRPKFAANPTNIMASENEILKRIKEKAGIAMNKSADFDTLAQAIKDKTNETLGVNTLKRMFGYKTDKVVPRLSTMDIISQFLGYEDYESLIRELGEDADISIFTPIDCIEVQNLERGTQIRISYEPNRVFFLTYLGDFKFIVNDVEGSHNIIKGDILTITQLAVGHRFVVSHVLRGELDLGAYESAKHKGLKSLEVLG